MLPIISSRDLRNINEAIEKGLTEIEVSLDFGLTNTKINLDKNGFYIDKELIKSKKIKETDKSCYIVRDNSLEKVQYFSDGRLYKLIPTNNRPILQISGTSMHKKDFLEKLGRDKLRGMILDSGTGLGYSSII